MCYLFPILSYQERLLSIFHTSTAHRDRTVLRRSKPSSRTALNSEQLYPWNLLQLQDAMSRHRGAERSPRSSLQGITSLLSPAYLLFVKQYLAHKTILDHYNRLNDKFKKFSFLSLFNMFVSQSSDDFCYYTQPHKPAKIYA